MIERDIENILEENLRAKGWKVDVSNTDRDVYHQSPRSPEEKKKLGRLEPDFCLYMSANSTSPEIVVETKKPGMDLEDAKFQAIRYAKLLGSKIVVLFDGLNNKTYWVDNEQPLVLNGSELDVIEDKSTYKLFIKSNSSEYTTDEITITTREELINVFAFANSELRSAGVTKGLGRFFDFSNLLFLKWISEDEQHIFESIPEHINWKSYKDKSGDELLSYINDTVMAELERKFNKEGRETIFSKLSVTDPLRLKRIIDKLDRVNFSSIQSDVKGDAFEYFIQKYNSTKGNDLAEYFTPRHLVKFLVKLADPQYGEQMYDPFCGTGGMLIETFNHILKKLKDKRMLTEAVMKDLKVNTIWGSEISEATRISKMN